MAKVEQYREIVQKLLKEYAVLGNDPPDIETEFICDTQGDHYQVVHVGWQGDRRIYGCSLHVDIKDNKVWLQHNGLESDIAAELVEMGVAQMDIVLAFHSPFKRQFTDYAVS